MTTIIWMRQDLRLSDNPALYHAAQKDSDIIPVYIYNPNEPWAIGGAQQWWLHHSLKALQETFLQKNIQLILRTGDPTQLLPRLIQETGATTVHWNRCYEPHAIQRDTALKKKLVRQGIEVNSWNGSLLFEPWEILNQQGGFFKVFGFFWKRCLVEGVTKTPLPIPIMQQKQKISSDTLEDWQLLPTSPNWAQGFKIWQPGERTAHSLLKVFIQDRLQRYAEQRDFPREEVTSHLSPYLHVGEISPLQIWHAIKQAEAQSQFSLSNIERYQSQLGWREFSYYLLYHLPALTHKNFREEFNGMRWEENKEFLTAWQQGKTGYPIVDAGMCELWKTGYMHNRVRMVVASFLTKDLLIDWRKGAQWFWDTLVDADLANNSASWQWVAGCGVDAAPYFRIFNPVLQGEKFDPQGYYVKKWLPQLAKLPNQFLHQPWNAPDSVLEQAEIFFGKNYPYPIVEHRLAREKALHRYGEIKKTRGNRSGPL